jgi:hypothetical protein
VAIDATTIDNNQIQATGTGTGMSRSAGRAFGGGIYASTDLSMTISTVSTNTATGSGTGSNTGGTAQGGGIYVSNTLELVSTTVAENRVAAMHTGTTTGPADASGGGLFAGSSTPGNTQPWNSIVARNLRSGTGGSGADVSGNLASVGYNLIGTTTGSTGWTGSDLTGSDGNLLDPGLGPLQYNGAGTTTYALLAGSPALDSGDPNLAGTTDQRRVVRGSLVNIGSFQATASQIVVSAASTVTAGVPFDVVVTLVDSFGQTAVGYVGTINLTSTDPAASFLGSYTFSLSDAGQTTFFAVVLFTSGTQTLMASDGATLFGSQDVTVM